MRERIARLFRDRARGGYRSAPILLLNLLLLVGVFALYGKYVSAYQQQLRFENLSNIEGLNESAAGNATALIESWAIKLDDIARYARRHNLTRDGLLAYLEDANSSESRHFELIGEDYTGYLARRDARGAFIPLSYAGSGYADLQKVFDGGASGGALRFAPEFTDSYSALKYFALYAPLTLAGEEGAAGRYTLLLAAKSADVLAAFNRQQPLEGMSTVLVDARGSYIVSSLDFKSDNFFQYLYVYNDLSLDERGAIEREMAQNGSGELYYKDGMGRESVFRYARMAANGWYCITGVPLSSFRTPAFSIFYALCAVLALLALLALDVIWLRGVNRQLRVSMRREKEASEAKTDFLSRMSHDIRTPLNGIIGMTILAQDEPNPPKTRQYLDFIRSSGNFLQGLVNDILDMSKVESGKMELHPEPYTREDFRKYIEAVIQPLCDEKKQTLVITPPADDRAVMFDRLRFNQIFFNLLSNAVKYTPEGGLIELFWEKAELPAGRVAFDFTVRDNGIGMSEAFQAHMFERFAQERQSANAAGTGLGLAIVWNLVRLMGGRVSAVSKEGQGSSFFVHLETAVSEAQSHATSASGAQALEGRRILLCEDNHVNALIAQRLLEKWGARVDIAENGQIGVDAFAASAPGTYDAILMDIQMPVMNGLDAARAIRRLNRPDAHLPIVAMTANAYDTDVHNSLDAGMNAHLGKPVQPDLLRSTLAGLLDPS